MESNYGTATAIARKTYETKVGMEAFERAGNNPQLKGIVHEVLYKDAQTMNPRNLVNGTKGILSKSTTAVRDDVLLMNNGTVVGRSQLKDTAQSISKTIKQASNGKYAGTKLMGTNETVQAYEKAVENLASKGTNVTQKMTSTGISSADTSRIAVETIGGKLSAQSLAKMAGSSGIAGGVISGGIETISAGKDLLEGTIDGEEFVGRVAKETVGGGISAAGGSAAATVVSAGVATALATTTAPVWIPAAVGIGAAVVVGSAIKGIWDSIF
ncbi:hypothetical protein [Novisyntrophococcus fermenticellae]|uniref:hypothetical protein n=1 Tax=Novisyntrophococcus fermenticellae TaxID=2068655 RepID=UPI001E2A71A7|nr:hypothetical protein [Novisyntrophococcus fermenticellae]